ncbi:MAG: AAA domain-containing protein [Deltaproteobacteria bacterium]|nr:AAA domain-containing protein [Deltaproteobacteria bacterium]
MPELSDRKSLETAINEFQGVFGALESEIARVIVGNEEIIRETLASIFAGGHVLLEGVPGLGKTLLVKSVSRAMGLSFKRIQFTPDLMPSDITGTEVLTEDDSGRRKFIFKPGPIFANVVLADEVNRATPKTQAAMLEAMEERQVSVLGQCYALRAPFFVLATQNPIELEGTYPLPEAQLDRFLMKLLLKPPEAADLKIIIERTTGAQVPEASPILPPQEVVDCIERLKLLVRQVVVADPIKEVLVRILAALTPGNEYATPMVKRYARFGPGPRGAQAVIMISKVMALLDGRINVAFDDIRAALLPCLRHRMILNFQAEADNINADDVLRQVKDAK